MSQRRNAGLDYRCAATCPETPRLRSGRKERDAAFQHNVDAVALFLRRYEYHWADGTNIKKPIKCSAPKYIDYLMTWVQDQLDDETLFPSKIGTSPNGLNVYDGGPRPPSLKDAPCASGWSPGITLTVVPFLTVNRP